MGGITKRYMELPISCRVTQPRLVEDRRRTCRAICQIAFPVPHSMSGAQNAMIGGTVDGTSVGSQIAPSVPMA